MADDTERKSLLAELTTKNANVFYELGLAHAIGKPVILVSETMDDVPFDLQQLRVLLYDKNDPEWGKKLSTGIASAISETLAKPIDAVPDIFRKTVASQAPEQDEMTARLEAVERQMRTLDADVRGQSIYTPGSGIYSTSVSPLFGDALSADEIIKNVVGMARRDKPQAK